MVSAPVLPLAHPPAVPALLAALMALTRVQDPLTRIGAAIAGVALSASSRATPANDCPLPLQRPAHSPG